MVKKAEMQSWALGSSESQVHVAVCVLLVRFTSVKWLHSKTWHYARGKATSSFSSVTLKVFEEQTS